MLVAGFPAGPWGTNCYVLASSAGSECLIVDPGMDAVDGVAELIAEHRLRPVAVLLTHGHLDHMWSVVPVADGYGIPALVHPGDRHLLADPGAGISPETRVAIQRMLGDGAGFVEPAEVREVLGGTTLDLAGIAVLVEHAPGHTPGSVTYGINRVEAAPLLLSGDVLFAGSIGRTDLPGGDSEAMMQSLGRVILPLDDATVVLPGHGESTTIGQERATNPFLRALIDSVPSAAAPRRGM